MLTSLLPFLPFSYRKLDPITGKYIPAASYVLTFFEPGGAVTPKNVFAANRTTSLGASITLDTNGYGYFELVGKYYVVFKTDTGTTVFEVDNVEEIATLSNVQNGEWCGTATGTANAIVLTPSLPVQALLAGQVFRFKSGAAGNTGPVTFAISGLAAIAGQTNFGACVSGEIPPGQLIQIIIDPGLTSCQISRLQPHYLAKTYSDIINSVGSSPVESGMQFFANNTSGVRKIFGAIHVEIQDATPGLESGRMHFLVNDENYSQVIGTIDKDGAWILGPGIASYKANICGVQEINSIPGDGLIFGERLAVVDPDYVDSRLLAVRNVASFDVNDLNYKAGIGFSIVNTATKERPVCTIRAQYVTRTAGIEDSKFHFTLLKQGAQVEGPVFEHDKHSKGTAAGAVPGVRAIKPLVINNASNYTMLRQDSGAVITNSGAKTKITITLPNLDSAGVGWNARIQTGVTPISLISGFKWTASTGDPGAYYLVTTADGNPGFEEPVDIRYYSNLLTKATVGTLANSQWGYGNVDTLGFNTIYLQPVEGDPDAVAVPFFATYKVSLLSDNTSFDGIYYPGSVDDITLLESDGKLGSHADFYSFNFMTNVRGWQGQVYGTWTKIS